jgi:histone-lysine N-methyltransferase SETMAR
LTHELRQKRIEGARTLLNVLEGQQRIGFRDIITGDESWIYLNMTPNSIWIRAKEIPPIRPRTTIASTKAMLTVFWGIRGLRLINWLPHRASFNGAYFDENILQPMASECHAGEEKKHCPWSLLHLDNARSHMSKRNLARMKELRLKRLLHPPFSHDITPSDFFLFGWLKSELSSRLVSEIIWLFEIINEILSTLTPDTIAKVFKNWIERLTQIININGDYV